MSSTLLGINATFNSFIKRNLITQNNGFVRKRNMKLDRHFRNLDQAFDIYSKQMSHLVEKKNNSPQYFATATEILSDFDVLLLDGYGVLNVGAGSVEGASDFVRYARSICLDVFLITNGGSADQQNLINKYLDLDIHFSPDEIISSRLALEHWLKSRNDINYVGYVNYRVDTPSVKGKIFKKLTPGNIEEWKSVDAICLFGTIDWNQEWQNCLKEVIHENKLILVANPDVVSPQLGYYQKEPGYWVFIASDQKIRSNIIWFGKPYDKIFDFAFSKIARNQKSLNLKRNRIALVGDSLHTDILGAQISGIKSILLTDYGICKNINLSEKIHQTRICPDYIVAKL